MKKSLLKLAVIGSVGVPAKYGGFETLVHFLVQNLHERLDLTVYCSEHNYAKEERVTYALGFGLNADAALAEGIAEMKRRNWSWIEDGHGYTVESTGEFD